MGQMVAVGVAFAAMIGLATAAGAEEPGSGPLWSLDVAALAWQRSTPDASAIVAANPSGTPFLSGSDLDFGLGNGIEAALTYQAFSATSIEVRLLSAKAEGRNLFASPGNFIGVGFTGPSGVNFVSDYETRLASGEVNLRHSYGDRFGVLAGVRTLSVDDALATTLNTTVATGIYEAENDLTGVQIGAEMVLGRPSDRWSLEGFGKLGAFRTKSVAGLRTLAGGNAIQGFSSGDTTTTYAAELGLRAEYRLSEQGSLTLGYQILWLDDLAQAATAANESLLNPSLLTGNLYRDDLSFQAITIGFSTRF